MIIKNFFRVKILHLHSTNNILCSTFRTVVKLNSGITDLKLEIEMKPTVLMAFDFDHTLINDNSDIYVQKLAPNSKIPPTIKALYSEKGWTKYMGEIFRYLHQNRVTPQEILDCMAEINFAPGMVDLLHALERINGDAIIISDSNSVFIEHILKVSALDSKILQTFTNPASFDSEGRLNIDVYHWQDACSLSTKNLCKGDILETYVSERKTRDNIQYDVVAYVGDGQNDLCPSLRLRSQDLVFPRVGFSLLPYIKKVEEQQGLKVQANIHPWNSGHDIMKVLQEHLNLTK